MYMLKKANWKANWSILLFFFITTNYLAFSQRYDFRSGPFDFTWAASCCSNNHNFSGNGIYYHLWYPQCLQSSIQIYQSGCTILFQPSPFFYMTDNSLLISALLTSSNCVDSMTLLSLILGFLCIIQHRFHSLQFI